MPDDATSSPADIGAPPHSPPKNDPAGRAEGPEVFGDLPNFTHLRNRRFHEQTIHLRREHWFRLGTAVAVFAVVCLWLIAVGVIVVLQGAKVLVLDSKVLVALLVTTTLNVIGLLAAVVRYLFPARPAVFGQDALPRVGGRPRPDRRP